MAFHQPTRQTFQRTFRPTSDDREGQPAAIETARPVEESQTWVLFSPATDADTSTSYLSSVYESQATPGRSRISDIGSLNTVARSDVNSQPANSAVPQAVADVMDEDPAEEDAELDSLDSHLPDFLSHLHNHLHASTTVLPRHDGLGSFRLDTAGMTSEMQEHMYAFERFNPRRVKRRRESLDLAQLQLEHEQIQELERHQRIEAWRLEQSRLLLEEVEKETRRRIQPDASLASARSSRLVSEAKSTLSSAGRATPETTTMGSEWHDQETSEMAREPGGIWSRITRKFMHDFMGVDDQMLSVLFGEALPEDEEMASTPKASTITQAYESHRDSSWQLRMLDRVSRELGMLVHHLSKHPGAFSSYARMQRMPLPYAGLPAIPESTADGNENTNLQNVDASTLSTPQFRPTVPQTQPIDIPGRSEREVPATNMDTNVNSQSGVTFTQQEWEQDLDVKLVFKYLRSRFLPRSSVPPTSTSHLATTSAQDTAAKIARVRQHHPLVGRSRQVERRTYRVSTPSSPVAMRHGSTCASQSTRRSARRSSVSSRHSSRHYWDLGGSLGTGSMIASTGPMGSWGEV